MGLRLICCGQPRFRIVEPNGRPRHFSAKFTISDILHLYPQYCISDASGSILSADAELEAGSTYLILPLPGVFPGSSSSFLHKEEEETAIEYGKNLIWKPRKPRSRMRARRDSNPRRFSRISTQERDNDHYPANKSPRRATSWQPSLDMISENDALLQTKDEQPVKKMKKETAKPRKYKSNHSLRNGVTASDLHIVQYLPGFMF